MSTTGPRLEGKDHGGVLRSEERDEKKSSSLGGGRPHIRGGEVVIVVRASPPRTLSRSTRCLHRSRAHHITPRQKSLIRLRSVTFVLDGFESGSGPEPKPLVKEATERSSLQRLADSGPDRQQPTIRTPTSQGIRLLARHTRGR